ncbi:Beta-microseminoprotein, partial [Apaloderma vittatum]
CRDSKGKTHLMGSRWMMGSCLRCYCFEDGIECCNNHPRPANYDTEKCISIFNKVTCTFKVVEKDDHSKVCPVHGWV